MLYDILRRLELEGSMGACSIVLSRDSAPDNRMMIFGREVLSFNQHHIVFRGGESGYEEFRAPLESVFMVEAGGHALFRRSPRIQKVYPR